ncbi:MAG: hypothetical protein JJW01_00195 [Alphaproteobacteria bacterium]|nr:hypothetical protein [Rickettsiales bacterium]
MNTVINDEMSIQLKVIALDSSNLDVKIANLNKVFAQYKISLENEEILLSMVKDVNLSKYIVDYKRSISKNLLLYGKKNDPRYVLNMAESLFVLNCYLQNLSKIRPKVQIKSCTIEINKGYMKVKLVQSQNDIVSTGLYSKQTKAFDIMNLLNKLFGFTDIEWEDLIKYDRVYRVQENEIEKTISFANQDNQDLSTKSTFRIDKFYYLLFEDGKTKIWSVND